MTAFTLYSCIVKHGTAVVYWAAVFVSRVVG
jgi:hypothetical protein